MLRSLLILICALLPMTRSLAQTKERNLEKYWAYQQRFDEGFVVLGEGRGESIPITGRAPQMDCENNWFIADSRCTVRKGKGYLWWSDSTIYLGQYIANLAMMVRNLKDAGQPHENEARQLLWAIKAFQRADYMAETYFGAAPKVDGFFLRDDVPDDVHLNEDASPKIRTKTGATYDCLQSHGSCKLDDVMDGSIASTDQILSLMMGFSFVCEMVPEVDSDGVNLADLARLQVHNIVNFLQTNHWKIKAPNGEIPPNRWGGDALAYSYDLAEAAQRLTKGKYKDSYHTNRSRNMGKIIIDTFNWAHFAQTKRNRWMAYAAIISSGRWNAKRMARKTAKRGNYLFALAYCAVNKKELHRKIKRKDMERLLDSAPLSGPCFNSPGCKAPDGWKGQNYWIEAKKRNGNPYGLHMEFNGLDYMLFYNLYYFFYKNDLPPYKRPIAD